MIELRRGDILAADAEALVNTVNCVGIMGRGIALQFKNAFPRNFKLYEAACRADKVQPGSMFVVEVSEITNPRYIINFPTKRHWRGKSKLSDIGSGLADLVAVVDKLEVKSIAIPPLGCGLGGLDWTDVKPMILGAFESLPDVHVLLFEPDAGVATPRQAKRREAPKMSAGRAALIGLMQRYLGGLMDPTVSLLEIHKLMYFMQAAGQDLRLRYTAGHYGPYAENLRHVLKDVEGHFLSGYADGGDDPTKPMMLVPGASREASVFLADHPDTQERFDRVSDLVEGFETSFGLELLATVHWVAKHSGTLDAAEITEKVHGWSERKKMFAQRQIEIALDTLDAKGWTSTHASS